VGNREGGRMKNILILCESPEIEIVEYFENRKFVVLDNSVEQVHSEVDYIIVDNERQAQSVSENYSTEENGIQIICLGEVYDQKSFLTFSGRLSLDSDYFKSPVGLKILNKFFSEKYSLHLNDHFEDDLKNFKSFKITNHLSSGLYLDEIAVDSFEAGFNLISMRSYLDHIINYFTYLKQAGLAGVPYEVEYAHNDDFFVVNTYLTVREFVAEYMIDSFGKVNSKDPMKYLLGVAAEASDFMEITYFENPGRLAITAMWNKEKRNYGTSVALHNIQSYSDVRKNVDFQIKSFEDIEDKHDAIRDKQERLVDFDLPGGITELIEEELNEKLSSNKEEVRELIAVLIAKSEEDLDGIENLKIDDLEQMIEDIPETDFLKSLEQNDIEQLFEKIQNKNLSKVILEEIETVRGDLKDDESFKTSLKESISDEVSERISEAMDVQSINRLLSSDDKDKDEDVQRIKGSKEGEEFLQTIKGIREDKDDAIQVIKNSLDESKDELKQIISGNHDPLEKKGLFRNLIDKSISHIDKDLGLFNNKASTEYLQTVLPREIELGMDEYARKIGKTLETLSDFEVEDFQQNELTAIIGDFIVSDDLVEDYVETLEDKVYFEENGKEALRQELKDKLEKSLEDRGDFDRVNGSFVITEENLNDEEFRQIIKSSMKESLENKIQLNEASLDELDLKEREIIDTFSDIVEDPNSVSEVVSAAIDQVKKKEVEEVAKTVSRGKETPKSSEGQSNTEKELLKRVKQSELKNKKLQTQNKLLEGKLKAENQASKRLEKINEKVDKQYHDLKQRGQSDPLQTSDDNAEKETFIGEAKDKLLQNIESKEALNEDQTQKIKSILEKEKKLLSLTKNYELEIKKLEHDLKHKDSLFRSEVVRVERMSKGKDIILEKTKDNLTSLVQQKEKKNKDLQNQLQELTHKMKNDQTAVLKKDMLKLKKDNELLAKSAEMFKSRLESMSKMNQAKAQKTDSEQIIEEHRVLKMEKTGLTNKVKAFEKEVKSWETRLSKSQELEKKHKDDSAVLKNKLSFVEEQMRALKANEAKRSIQSAESSDKKQDLQNNKEFQNLKGQNLQLQKKLKDLMAKSKGTSTSAGGVQNQSSKEKILEKDKKRLQQEITKSKQEADSIKKAAMKFKGENMKLQNANDKYQKDIARLEKKLKSLASLSGKKAA
jgi:hypothetical protein